MILDPYDYFARRLDAQTELRIAAFWKHFEKHADGLDQHFSSGMKGKTDSVEVMAALSEIDPGLMWEFGPAENGHTLAITAEWRDELRPLARAVLAAAPSLEQWEFSDVRGAELEFDNFIDNFAARFRTQLTVSEVRAEPGVGGRIDLTISGKGKADAVADQGLMIATELLGEEVERDWLGFVDYDSAKKLGLIQRLRGNKEQVVDFDPNVFLDCFREAIAQAKSKLPEEPYYAMPRKDRPTNVCQVGDLRDGHPRSDLITYSVRYVNFGDNIFHLQRFSSQTHSLHGEWFCGLRIMHNPENSFDALSDRHLMENALHNALSVDCVGGYVGAGHGTEAIYIDLALLDIEKGLERIIDVVTKAGLAEHAQITFLDQGLSEFVIPCQTGKTVVH